MNIGELGNLPDILCKIDNQDYAIDEVFSKPNGYQTAFNKKIKKYGLDYNEGKNVIPVIVGYDGNIFE